MGKLIRSVTRAVYNHVSISLDPELHTMYGFARRFYRTPLYGGFVVETPCRYRVGQNLADIKICRIPISAEAHDALRRHLEKMSAEKERYLYNHLSVIGIIAHRRIQVKDAYMCIEFCIDALQLAGLQVDPKKYYSIKQAEQLLQPYVTYTGPMVQDAFYDHEYFARRPLPHPILSSIISIAALLPRLRKI